MLIKGSILVLLISILLFIIYGQYTMNQYNGTMPYRKMDYINMKHLIRPLTAPNIETHKLEQIYGILFTKKPDTLQAINIKNKEEYKVYKENTKRLCKIKKGQTEINLKPYRPQTSTVKFQPLSYIDFLLKDDIRNTVRDLFDKETIVSIRSLCYERYTPHGNKTTPKTKKIECTISTPYNNYNESMDCAHNEENEFVCRQHDSTVSKGEDHPLRISKIIENVEIFRNEITRKTFVTTGETTEITCKTSNGYKITYPIILTLYVKDKEESLTEFWKLR